MSVLEVIGTLRNRGCLVHMHGSAYVCDPPHLDTDIDYCVFVPPLMDPRGPQLDGWAWTLHKMKEQFGFGLDSGRVYDPPPDGSVFVSLRRDNLNFIITTSIWWYTRHVDITAKLKAMNLHDKRDRIAVFKWLMTGERSWRAFKCVFLHWCKQ